MPSHKELYTNCHKLDSSKAHNVAMQFRLHMTRFENKIFISKEQSYFNSLSPC